MSDALFPALDGLTYPTGNAAEFVTLLQRTAGGNETRAKYYAAPIRHWHLEYSFLDLADYALMTAFYTARVGPLQSFLFIDTAEDLELALIGTGDGAEDDFSVLRVADSGAVVTDNSLLPTIAIYLDAVLQDPADYTISADDVVTFNTPPAFSVLVWAQYAPLHRVRFDSATLSLNEFIHQLWAAKQIDLVGVL